MPTDYLIQIPCTYAALLSYSRVLAASVVQAFAGKRRLAMVRARLPPKSRSKCGCFFVLPLLFLLNAFLLQLLPFVHLGGVRSANRKARRGGGHCWQQNSGIAMLAFTTPSAAPSLRPCEGDAATSESGSQPYGAQSAKRAEGMLADAAASLRDQGGQGSAAILDALERLRAQACSGDRDGKRTAVPYANSSAIVSRAIKACATAEHWELSVSLLNDMRGAQLEPESEALEGVASACEDAELHVRLLRLQLAGRPFPSTGVSQLPLPPGPCDRVPMHFCIFQSDVEGLSGWSLARGSIANRWDVLLDGLLKCLMMDGEWPRDVCASAFVGPDALHLSGEVQRLVMPQVGRRDDGRPMYQPATFKAWEETLWRAADGNSPGLCWQRGAAKSGVGGVPQLPDEEAAKSGILHHLDEVLAGAPSDAVVLVFSVAAGDTNATYDELMLLGEEMRARGTGRHPYVCSRAYIVMAGARGFDGHGDEDGGVFMEAVLEKFAARLGRDRVMRVSLCEDISDVPIRLPLAQIASFVSVEYMRGAFGPVLAACGKMAAGSQ